MPASGPSPHLSGIPLFGLPVPGAGPPFLVVLKELDTWLSGHQVSYAIIGGVAVVRSGSSRTTGDIDLLVRREEWNKLLESDTSPAFRVGDDWAEHRKSGVPVDVLFAADDWGLPFLLSDPEVAREWDPTVGAWFMTPAALLELKAAVYLSKKAEFGEAPAAHDLADLTALLTANPGLREFSLLDSLHPSVRDVLKTARRDVERYRRKQPRNRSGGG